MAMLCLVSKTGRRYEEKEEGDGVEFDEEGEKKLQN